MGSFSAGGLKACQWLGSPQEQAVGAGVGWQRHLEDVAKQVTIPPLTAHTQNSRSVCLPDPGLYFSEPTTDLQATTCGHQLCPSYWPHFS